MMLGFYIADGRGEPEESVKRGDLEDCAKCSTGCPDLKRANLNREDSYFIIVKVRGLYFSVAD